MAGQSDYLPPGLPLNRAKWPQECQLKEHYDMRAAPLRSFVSSMSVKLLARLLFSTLTRRRRVIGSFSDNV